MQLYNKITLFFWFVFSVVSFLIVTYQSITIGFDRWAYYYLIPFVTLMMFFLKRWMMRRMIAHQKFLAEKAAEEIKK
ncbi:MAG: hypothetical protein P8I93_00420 [Crocinitomicaceae bacterium]|nr:hypothetical protein [Crocinitomicaceae bacterium]